MYQFFNNLLFTAFTTLAGQVIVMLLALIILYNTMMKTPGAKQGGGSIVSFGSLYIGCLGGIIGLIFGISVSLSGHSPDILAYPIFRYIGILFLGFLLLGFFSKIFYSIYFRIKFRDKIRKKKK